MPDSEHTKDNFKQAFDREMQAAYADTVRSMNRYHPKPGPPPAKLQKIKSKWFWVRYRVRKSLANRIDPDA